MLGSFKDLNWFNSANTIFLDCPLMAMRTAVFCAVLLQLTLACDLTFDQVETVLQNLTARVNKIEVNFGILDLQLTTLDSLLSNCLKKIAFRVDFGKEPYSIVDVGQYGVVKFNREQINLGGGYNLSTGIFTAPKNGLYICGLQIIGSSLYSSTVYEIVVNNSVAVAVAHASGNNPVNDKGTAVTVVQLAKGDTVNVKHRNGVPYLWGSTLTAFVCVRVAC